MSNAITKSAPVAIETFNQEQRELIKRTVAPNATDDELAMFLHVAGVTGLDPLRKQIHFLKTGNRVSFIADVNGLQSRAAREADYVGIEFAAVNEGDDFIFDRRAGKVVKHESNPFKAGRPIGAWAIVTRRNMLPFVSMVKFSEYDNPNNALWKTKPTVMIEKCAKSTALRLAYPEQLGSVYEEAELGKEEKEVNPSPAAPNAGTLSIKNRLAARVAKSPEPAPEAPPKPPLLIDVAPGETEQQAEQRQSSVLVVWPLVQALMARHGKAGPVAAVFIKETTGKADRKALTMADYAALCVALEGPLPTDDDAPPEAI